MATKKRSPLDAKMDATIENMDVEPDVRALLHTHHEKVIADEEQTVQNIFDSGVRSAEKSAEDVAKMTASFTAQEILVGMNELIAAVPAKAADLTTQSLLGRKHQPRKSASDEVTALVMDVPEAAKNMGLSEKAFRSRLQRGQIPEHVIRREGKRVQLIRSKFIAWVESGSPNPNSRPSRRGRARAR